MQTLRTGDPQGQTPIALPVIDYRLRLADPLLGGQVTGELVGSQITEEAVLDAIMRGADAALSATPAEGDS